MLHALKFNSNNVVDLINRKAVETDPKAHSSRMSRYNLRTRRKTSNEKKEGLKVDTHNISCCCASPHLHSSSQHNSFRRNLQSTAASFSTSTSSSSSAEFSGILLFKEEPRQIFFLVFVVLTVSYYAFTHDSNDLQTNVRSGLTASCFIFCVYCFLQTRDGLLVRPHPGLWRIIHGLAVLYLLLLSALSVQNIRGARAALHLFFPDIDQSQQHQPDFSHLGGGGKDPQQEQEVVVHGECQITLTSLMQALSSIWFVAHTVGWWAKMCMFRDWRFCFFLSLIFELLELTLQFIIPDFKECWWDSLGMDLFGANMLGMYFGSKTLQYLETKEYDWSGKRGLVRRALDQFTPFSWSRYHWEVFSSFKRFAQVLFPAFMTMLLELNAFFLLNTLNFPKESNFNKYRLFLIFLLGIPAVSEYYEFLSNPDCWRIGQNAWLICLICCFEVLIWVKFFGELSPVVPSPDVYYPWLAFLLLFSVWMVLFFSKKKKKTNKALHSPTSPLKSDNWPLDLLFYASFTPLLYLVKQWGY